MHRELKNIFESYKLVREQQQSYDPLILQIIELVGSSKSIPSDKRDAIINAVKAPEFLQKINSQPTKSEFNRDYFDEIGKMKSQSDKENYERWKGGQESEAKYPTSPSSNAEDAEGNAYRPGTEYQSFDDRSNPKNFTGPYRDMYGRPTKTPYTDQYGDPAMVPWDAEEAEKDKTDPVVKQFLGEE
jgi:hypothetical protein